MKEIPITSFDNLQIGQAENTAAGTGCTVVLLGKDGAPAGLDVRGGGPASRESELLKPLAAAQVIHAIVLAGGSAFGLDAAGGVMRYLEERGIGFDVGVNAGKAGEVDGEGGCGVCDGAIAVAVDGIAQVRGRALRQAHIINTLQHYNGRAVCLVETLLHVATHRHRLASQFRTVQAFHAGVKII